MADSILTPAQEGRFSQYFDDLVARAELPAPKLADFNGDLDAFSKNDAAYKNNPLFDRVKAYESERNAQVSNGASEEQANALYSKRINELKNNFIDSAAHAPDPNAAERIGAAFDALLNLDFQGAIKQIFMALPFVGNLMGAGMKWAKSNFLPGGEKISFEQAQERIILERALGHAAGTVGLEGRAAQSFVSQGINITESADYVPMQRPAVNPNFVSVIPAKTPKENVLAPGTTVEPASRVETQTPQPPAAPIVGTPNVVSL